MPSRRTNMPLKNQMLTRLEARVIAWYRRMKSWLFTVRVMRPSQYGWR